MDAEKNEISEILNNSLQCTEEGKNELYLYSLKKMAEENAESNKISLTNLYNLRAFYYKAAELMIENPDKRFAVIILDIANFKSVNEFCGRAIGDELLKMISDAFRKYENEYTLLSHFRADIFGMLTSFRHKNELVDITKQIAKEISDFKIACKVLPAFGICRARSATMPISVMCDYATMALNTIKGKFYANYAFFDEKMRKQMLIEKHVENDIVEALETGQINLFIQPKVNMKTGEVIGGEALVRWIHPTRGVICPSDFLPILEKNGLIINVDIFIWNEVFKLISKRLKEGKKVVPVSVNISRLHAYHDEFKDCLIDLCKKYNVPAKYVPLELTESAFLAETEVMYERMKQLKKSGFIISMDDFGTGYSTMTMLKNQPVDEIKIDKGFIDDIDNNRSKIIVSHTIEMIRELGISVTVEGVEQQQQQDFLQECGCDEAQGFYYYKPMCTKDFEKLLD